MKYYTSQFPICLAGVIWLIVANGLWVELPRVTFVLRQWKTPLQYSSTLFPPEVSVEAEMESLDLATWKDKFTA